MKSLLAAAIVFVIAIVLLYSLAPRPEARSVIASSSVYLDDEGRLLRLSLARDDRYRVYHDLADISPQFIEATILYEDQHFYDHAGVDFVALMRAFWTTYITGDRRIGASTITMQVARLKWGIVSNTIVGKIQQILRAIQLTKYYSRQEILEIYLNLAPYGRNIEGVGAASLIYFNKKPQDLSLPEILTLAVIPQNPNKRNPTTERGYHRLLKAREILFQRWVEHHPEDARILKFLDLPLKVRSPEQLPFKAPHFVDYLSNNKSDWDNGYIKTTLNASKQRRLETILQSYVASRKRTGIGNASALLVNYETMSIEAMIGSADFFKTSIQGQVNAATAKRSPGSTLKPFVYALSMDEGLVHPYSLLKDSPRKYGGFSPENYDKQFLGPISVKEALIQSRNVPAVDLQSLLTKKTFYQFLKEAGISELQEEAHYGLALALGGGEVTMIELATLYAMLANNGELKALKSVIDEADKPGKKLLSPESSFLTLDILKDNPPPDFLSLPTDATFKNDIAWKTGTSWAFRDAWAVGISGPYVLVVWVGNFDGKGNDAFIGRSAAGPLLFSMFESIYPDQGWKLVNSVSVESLNLKKLRVCSSTGDLNEQDCPSTIQSWFIPGVSPIKLSNVYRRIPVDIKTGLRACWHEQGKTEMKVFQFWPSDFLRLFNRAGISLKTPPKFEQDCALDLKSNFGQIPVITSPQSSIDYVLNLSSDKKQLILFKAIVDPDVLDVHWFIDDIYVGSSNAGEAFIWEAQPGNFQIRAVDDYGRGASQFFNVIQYH